MEVWLRDLEQEAMRPHVQIPSLYRSKNVDKIVQKASWDEYEDLKKG